MLSYRASVSPRAGWTEEQFAASARTKQKRFRRLRESFARWNSTLEGAWVLDVGCGDGANCVLLSEEPVRLAVGLDLHLPLFAPDDEGQRARALMEKTAGAGTERARSAAALLSDRQVCGGLRR